MSAKFILRTARNLVVRRCPYFAHLAITHRCNLRCHFCHIPEWKIDEQDFGGMKRIIDRLDCLGVAILSISGGGEPLIRKDFAEIINYAADRGLYTKITSNGTMPMSKYCELLRSEIAEIGISVDGVDGNELPFAHVGPRILETIRYLNDHLPSGKHLTLNVTLSCSNIDRIHHIVDYCTRQYPRARIWLNPVVVGEGQLRVLNEAKVNPEVMYQLRSPTLLTPRFYTDACCEYYRRPSFDWKCLAGEMFFDIKPNGDFWMCQDRRAMPPLNILDPDFEQKYKQSNLGRQRACSGCTYSCYFMPQKSFEPKNWKQLAGVYWWRQVTQPDEPCRRDDERHPMRALLQFCSARLKPSFARAAVAIFFALALTAGASSAQMLGPEEVLTRVEQRSARQNEQLQWSQHLRSYEAENTGLHRKGDLLARVRYDAPDRKAFTVLNRHGSGSIQGRVFDPLIKAEKDGADPKVRAATEICRRNYEFTFERFDETGNAYLFRIAPKTDNRFLVRGQIWIDAHDFAVRRIEGEPAQRPSFWVRKTHFVHEYRKFGDYWFPVSNHTQVELRLLGNSNLTIEYKDYEWQGLAPTPVVAEGTASAEGPDLARPRGVQ